MSIDVRNYIRHPLSVVEFDALFGKLSNRPSDLIRDGHSVSTWADVIDHLTKHPKAMQRPIVVLGEQAVLARPADKVNTLFDA